LPQPIHDGAPDQDRASHQRGAEFPRAASSRRTPRGRSWGIIFHDTAKPPTPLLLTKNDEDPVPFGVVVFDAWYVAEAVVRVLARRRKDWMSLLNKNRRLEPASLHGRDANGWPLKLPGPHMAVEALVPRIPATARIAPSPSTHTPIEASRWPSASLGWGKCASW
jgi:hypothetical protein